VGKQLTVELWVLAVEGKLGLEVINVFGDETSVAFQAIAATSASLQTVKPLDVGLCLLKDYWMAFLKDLVNGDERFECLDFVGHDGLPVTCVSTIKRVQRIYSVGAVGGCTHTFIPCQKEAELL